MDEDACSAQPESDAGSVNHRNLIKPDLGKIQLGSWCQIGHPANAEILARAGFSWLAADCEHGEFQEADLANFCRAVRQFECLPLVRVRENDTLVIRRALDLGAAGVIVPLVNTKEEAASAVAAARYPNRGVRGFAWQKANSYGADFQSYAADFDPIVVVMMESKNAVNNVESIMSVEGVDACLIGPYDLSGSYGVVGQTSHPLVLEACSNVAKACIQLGKAAGQHIVTPDKAKVAEAIQQGYKFLALGMDSYFLGEGARQALAMGI